METKNIVATIYLKDGKAVKSLNDFTEIENVYDLCQMYNDSGIDKIVIFDLSTSDDEHEKNVNTIKNINRNLEIKFVPQATLTAWKISRSFCMLDVFRLC